MDQSPAPMYEASTQLTALASRTHARGCAVMAFIASVLAFSTAAHADSLIPALPERVMVDENGVDVMTGAISRSEAELSIGSDAFALSLADNYGGGDSLSGMLDVYKFGQWNVNRTVTASWGVQSWIFESYSASSRARDGVMLSYGQAGYKVTTRDGTVITYSMLTPGYFCPSPSYACHEYYFATEAVYPNGLVITPHYKVFLGATDFALRVQSVTSSAGYQIKFTYASNTPGTSGPWEHKISATAINNAVEYCDPMADACSLSGSWPTVSYDWGAGYSNVTDALGRTTQHTSGPTFSRTKTPASAANNVQYTLASFTENGGPVRRVTSVTRGSRTWTYTYSLNAALNPTQLTTTSQNALGGQTVYKTEINTNGRRLQSIKDPLNRTASFSNCAGVSWNAVYGVTAPEGNGIARTCDGRGNVTLTVYQPKTGSGAGSRQTTTEFPATCDNPKTCNQPLWTVDARGAQTDYSWDPLHGQLAWQKLPAPSPGGVRPETRYSYQQISAYVRNASGALVPAATSVWMPVRISACRTQATCANTADEMVTTLEYGAEGSVNRLLLRGTVVTAAGVSRRTCYGYDNIGNRISETTPRAGLSACP
jgi:hypothetical protein